MNGGICGANICGDDDDCIVGYYCSSRYKLVFNIDLLETFCCFIKSEEIINLTSLTQFSSNQEKHEVVSKVPKQYFDQGRCVKRKRCNTHDDCKAFKPFEYCRKTSKDGYCYKNYCQDNDDCNQDDQCNFKDNIGICAGPTIITGKIDNYLACSLFNVMKS